MVEKSLARFKLEQSCFFKTHASEAISAQQRVAFYNFIEAAIVFSRSVTLFLQKEYRHKPGFNNWYSSKQEMMKEDPIFEFFLKKRNYVLKEGSAGVYRVVHLTGKAKIGFSSFAELNVIRGQPWYHQRMKILWEDLRATITKPIRRWLWECKIKLKNLQLQRHSKVRVTKTVITTEDFFFDDPKWKDRPACGLLQEYLNKLGQIVDEAETRFDKEYS